MSGVSLLAVQQHLSNVCVDMSGVRVQAAVQCREDEPGGAWRARAR